MICKVMQPVDVEIDAIRITLPIRYGDEDMPFDFPFRDGDTWRAVVQIDTGKIYQWPQGVAGEFSMKVCDSGVYDLIAPHSDIIATRSDYVPHGVVPGEYGDYVELNIGSDGVITNWPKSPDVSAFFESEN